MTKIQDMLKDLTDRFKKTSTLPEERIENMKKTIEAAKQESKRVKTEKA